MSKTIGEQLREVRESKALTLDQISEILHIKTSYLQALEADDQDSLPSNVQAKGYLRLYASYLNMPVQPLLDEWNNSRKPEPEISSSANPKQESKYSEIAITDGESPIFPDLQSEEVPSKNTKSDVIFTEIGRSLQKQRESLGISLDEIERYTHIRTHYINKMEAGYFNELPSPVQRRGMLSLYAHFLEMDVDEVLLKFAEGLQLHRLETTNIPETVKVPEATGPSHFKRSIKIPAKIKRFLTPDLLVGGSIILFLFIFALWSLSQVTTATNQNIEETAPSISEVLSTNPSSISPNKLDVSPVESQTAAPQNFAGEQEIINTDPIELEPTVPIQNIDDKPIQVYIIANQRAWMKITADDKEVFVGRVVPGNVYPFSANNKIELSTGNAAALQVFYNQSDLGILGIMEEAKDLVFSKEGYQQPTPAFTATFTPTVAPTQTPTPSPVVPTPTVTPFIP